MKIKEILKEINQFRDERNWRQFHNEKDLSLSISLEAAELLELFQWKSSEEVVGNKQEISRRIGRCINIQLYVSR